MRHIPWRSRRKILRHVLVSFSDVEKASVDVEQSLLTGGKEFNEHLLVVGCEVFVLDFVLRVPHKLQH